MVEPALPPLPDRNRKPVDNPVAAEPPVPPAAAAEPVEVNEVISSVIPCVLRYVPRVFCRRSLPAFSAAWPHYRLFVCVSFASLRFIVKV